MIIFIEFALKADGSFIWIYVMMEILLLLSSSSLLKWTPVVPFNNMD